MRSLFILFALLLSISSTLHASDEINQLELQESLQRFYTRFAERTLESLLRPSLVNNPALREDVLRQYLLYDTEALKIVTGAYPEINLLDMVAFIKLNTLVVRDYWVPKVWKKDGVKLLGSFRESERDIDSIARKILSKDQIESMNRAVRAWREQYPDHVRVEKIRFDDFSSLAGANKDEGGFSLKGLLVDTKGATIAADQMALVANRGIFLAQAMPSLLRLQTRVGVAELGDDLGHHLKRFDHTMKELNGMSPVLSSLNELTVNTESLVKTFRKEFPKNKNGGLTKNLSEIRQIVDKSSVLVSEIQRMEENNKNVPSLIRNELKEIILYAGLIFVIAGSLVSAVWWFGHYLVLNRPGRARP
ncbi:MAG: hypothetical protein ACJ76H_07950 [Bacteriovoracaceae bacterium]